MLNKCLSVFLALSIIGAVGTLIYFGANPKVGETFTEFYILGPGGKAENYPQQLTLGETANVTVGVINHENIPTNYRVKVLMSGQESDDTGPILLGDGEKWENVMTFTPTMSGDNQKVEFLLYKSDNMTSPANSLHLWVNVNDEAK
jgi:uncharacterized membrane protein